MESSVVVGLNEGLEDVAMILSTAPDNERLAVRFAVGMFGVLSKLESEAPEIPIPDVKCDFEEGPEAIGSRSTTDPFLKERVISTSAASAQTRALGFEARTVTCSQLPAENSRAILATEYASASRVKNAD